MGFGIEKASNRLSKLAFSFTMDNVLVEVLWFRVLTIQDEWVISRHMHSTYEFHYIASGSCNVQLEDKAFEVKEGEFYLTGPGVYHTQTLKSGEKLVEYSLNCELKLADDAATESRCVLEILRNTDARPVRDKAGLIRHFSKALREAYYQKTGFYNNIKAIIITLLCLSARALQNTPALYQVARKTDKYEFVFEQIKKYIADNLSGPIQVRDLAAFIHISEKQVGRIICKVSGMGTKALINKIRHEHAKELLIKTNFSVKEIADLLGYSSEYYFSQFFKRMEGMPPVKFRANVHNVR